MSKNIYLDYAATTPVDNKVIKSMEKSNKNNFGNSSSLHKLGRKAKDEINKVRNKIKNKLNAQNHKVIFTSGGSESNNLAIKGLAFKNKNKKHIITSKIEHDCVLKSCKWLEKQGYKITYLDVDKNGYVDLNQLKKEIKKDTLLVSIIHANNEIGSIQNLKKIGEICHKKNILFHTDACQSFCKENIDLEKDNVDLITINAHKIYGPKGVGALIIKDNIKLTPLIHGGGHEYGLRSGTLNTPGIVGFSKAIDVIKKKDIKHIKDLQKRLINSLLEIKDCWLNGPKENRLCNNVNISFKGAEGESILLHLDSKNIYVSTGSACSSNTLEESHVLRAIALKKEETHGAIRFSIGKETTKKDIDKVIENVKKIVKKLRDINPLY